MLVYFFVQAVFTEGVTRTLFTRVKKDPKPFVELKGKGGYKSKLGSFQGVIDLDSQDYDELAYLITEALVKKVEANSRAGVESVDYKEITFGADSETRGTLYKDSGLTSQVEAKKLRPELIEILVTKYNHSRASVSRLSLEELRKHLACEEKMETLICQ